MREGGRHRRNLVAPLPGQLQVAGLAVASGAALLERHVAIPLNSGGINAYSLTPEQIEQWIDVALAAHSGMGFGQPRHVTDSERASLRSLSREIYVRASKSPGEFLEPEDLVRAMPQLEHQFAAGDIDEVVGLPVPLQGIQAMMPVMRNGGPRRIPAEVLISSIVEQVKAMLAERPESRCLSAPTLRSAIPTGWSASGRTGR